MLTKPALQICLGRPPSMRISAILLLGELDSPNKASLAALDAATDATTRWFIDLMLSCKIFLARSVSSRKDASMPLGTGPVEDSDNAARAAIVAAARAADRSTDSNSSFLAALSRAFSRAYLPPGTAFCRAFSREYLPPWADPVEDTARSCSLATALAIVDSVRALSLAC